MKLSYSESIRTLQAKLREYMDSQSIKISASRSFSCPNKHAHKHGDKTPSGWIYEEGDYPNWRCMTCGESGDVFNIASLIHSLPLSGKGFILETIPHVAEKVGLFIEVDNEEEIEENLKLSIESKKILKENHIDHKLLMDGTFGSTRKYKEEIAKDLVETFDLALLESPIYDNPILHPTTYPGYMPMLIPITKEGLLLGTVGRHTEEAYKNGAPKYQNSLKSEAFPYPSIINYDRGLQAAKKTKRVYIFEGVFNTLVAYVSGIRNTIGILGVNSRLKDLEEFMVEAGAREIVFCLDKDLQGADKSIELGKKFHSLGYICLFYKFENNGKDYDIEFNENDKFYEEITTENNLISLVDYLLYTKADYLAKTDISNVSKFEMVMKDISNFGSIVSARNYAISIVDYYKSIGDDTITIDDILPRIKQSLSDKNSPLISRLNDLAANSLNSILSANTVEEKLSLVESLHSSTRNATDTVTSGIKISAKRDLERTLQEQDNVGLRRYKTGFENLDFPVDPATRIEFTQENLIGLLGKPSHGKCVDGMTIIWYNGAMKRIQTYSDILKEAGTTKKLKEQLLSFDENTKEFVIGKTQAIHRSNLRNGKLLETTYGHQLIGSDIHPLWCEVDGVIGYHKYEDISKAFKENKKIWIPIKSGHDLWNKKEFPIVNTSLEIHVRHDTYKKEKDISIVMNKDIGYLIGLLLGDGSITEIQSIGKGVRIKEITSADPEIAMSINQICNKEFGRGNVRKKQSSKYGLIIESPELAAIVRDLKLYGTSETKTIPDIVLDSNKDLAIGVLQGLFDTDGTVNKIDGTISHCTKSERMARDIQNILLALGIISSIVPKKVKIPNKNEEGTYYQNYIYAQEASKFHKIVGFRLTRKSCLSELTKDSSKTMRKRYPDSINRVMNKVFITRKERGVVDPNHDKYTPGRATARKWGNVIQPSKMGKRSLSPKRLLEFVKEMKAENITELSQYYKGNIEWFPLIKCEDRTNLDLYDYQVEEYHSFVGNGFINHNSLYLRNFAMYQALNNPDVMVFYFSTDDSARRTISWIIAGLSKIPFSEVMKPEKERDRAAAEHIREAQIKLKRIYGENLVIYDKEQVSDTLGVIRILNDAYREFPNKRFIAIMDNLYNQTDIQSGSETSKREALDNAIERYKYLTTSRVDIFINSLEVKKNTIGRLSESDIKETGSIDYRNDATMAMFNSFREFKKESRMYTHIGSTFTPIIELHMLKRKTGEVGFVHYFLLDGPCGLLTPVTNPEQISQFDALRKADNGFTRESKGSKEGGNTMFSTRGDLIG